MSRWFRHYAGMMRDEKLVSAAIKSGQTIERVLWIWGAILESAAEIDDGGRYELDAAEAAWFLRADKADVDSVLDALASNGRVADGCVVKWGNRQFQSDRSAQRVAAHRERKRAQSGASELSGCVDETPRNGDVTLQKRHGNAPETETEIYITPLPPLQGEKRATPKRKTALPADWQPDDFGDGADCQRIVASWPPHERQRQITKFTAYHTAKGSRMVDWQAAWKTWVINSEQFARPAPPGGDTANFARIGARRSTGPPVAVAAE